MNNINNLNNTNPYIPALSSGPSPLYLACEEGNIKQVELLLKNGADVNQQDSLGRTSLFIACQKNNFEIAELLLSRGANPNVTLSSGASLLSMMCYNDNKEMVELLLKNHADPNQILPQSKAPVVPLHIACFTENREIAKLLLQHKVDPYVMKLSIFAACKKGDKELLRLLLEKDEYKNVNLQITDDLTPLLAACRFKHPEIVELLLKKGADVYVETSAGYCPIHIACKAGCLKSAELLLEHDIKQIDLQATNELFTPLMVASKKNKPEIVKFLLEKGANKKLFDLYGFSAIHLACMHNSLEATSQLLENDETKYINFLDESGNTPLIWATAYNNKEVLKFLIDKKADINIKDTTGYNAFHIACEEGHLEIVKQLLDPFKDQINLKTPTDETPLLIACINNHEEIVEFLIECGADIEACDDEGFNTFHFACQNGWVSAVEQILNKKKKYPNIERKTHGGNTPLLLACQQSEKEIVEILLSHGADINAHNNKGDSPLMVACRVENQEMIKFLIQNKANIESKDKEGLTPLLWACKKGKKEIFELLLQLNASVDAKDLNGRTALHWACRGGNLDIVKRLTAKEPEKILEARTKDANTPLMLACANNQWSVIEFLLGLGANKDLVNLKGYKPLHHACEGGSLEAVEMLLKESPNELNLKTRTGLTPLMIACQKGDKKMVEWLLQNKADVTAFSGSRDTALHYACSNSKEIVELLYAHKADLNAKNLNNETPLHVACENNQEQIAKFLLENSALVDAKNIFGDFPIHFAVSRQNYGLACLLIQHGANVNAVDSNGRTCLIRACQYGLMDLVMLLITNNADINAMDFQKMTPLKMAVENEHIKIVQFLYKLGANAKDVDFSSIYEFPSPVDVGSAMDLRYGSS